MFVFYILKSKLDFPIIFRNFREPVRVAAKVVVAHAAVSFSLNRYFRWSQNFAGVQSDWLNAKSMRFGEFLPEKWNHVLPKHIHWWTFLWLPVIYCNDPQL